MYPMLFLPQLMSVNCHLLLEIVTQPYEDSSSTVPLRDVRYSYTEDVVGMQTILLRNLSVPELVNQVHTLHIRYVKILP